MSTRQFFNKEINRSKLAIRWCPIRLLRFKRFEFVSLRFVFLKYLFYFNIKLFSTILNVNKIKISVYLKRSNKPQGVNVCYLYIKTVCHLWSQKKNFATNTHQSLIKSRERITKLLGMVIVAFTFTSLPFYATFIAYSFLGNNVGEPILQVLLNLFFSGSCINPLLYWFHNRKFREVAKRMLRCKT